MNKEIFEKDLKEFIYEPYNKIKITEYYESKICEPKEETAYKGKNYIKYYNGETKTVVSEINIKYEVGEGRTRRTIQQFNGNFFTNKLKRKITEEAIFIQSKRGEWNISLEEDYFVGFVLIMIFIAMPIQLEILIFGIVAFLIFMWKYIRKVQKESKTVDIDEMFNKYFYINGDKRSINKIVKSNIIEEFIKFEKKSKIKIEVSVIKNNIYIQCNNIETLYENNFGKCFSRKFIECVEFNNLICDKLTSNQKENNG